MSKLTQLLLSWLGIQSLALTEKLIDRVMTENSQSVNGLSQMVERMESDLSLIIKHHRESNRDLRHL